MESAEIKQVIIDKIKNGTRFGLFESGKKCFFEDGRQVGYSDLWAAVRQMHGLDETNKKSLLTLCPDTYIGSFGYKFSKHNWKK